jgi:hypothetical protein
MATKRFADDYETVITTDEKGNEKKTAVYRGEYFEVALDYEGMLRFKRKCLLLLAAIIVLHISGGFVNNPGMNQFYTGLPYVIAFFPLLYLAMATLRLPQEKRNYQRDEIGLSFGRMKTSSYVLLILLGMGVLGELAFLLVFSTGDQSMLEFLYLALAIITAAAVYFLITLQKQIRILPIANNNENHVS